MKNQIWSFLISSSLSLQEISVSSFHNILILDLNKMKDAIFHMQKLHNGWKSLTYIGCFFEVFNFLWR